jgi:TonB family protein
VFEAVTTDGKRGRRRRRLGALALSAAVQAVVAVALAAHHAAPPPPPPRQGVPVKFVKGVPRPVPDLALPPPAPPPAPPPRPAPVAARRPAAAPPRAEPLRAPAAVPDALPAPGPPEPPAPEPPAAAAGVVGGAPGAGVEAGEGTAAPPEPDRPLDFDAASMSPPVFLSGPAPAYTRAAIQHEVEGLMVIACVVTREGAVRDCRVRQGLPHLDEAVVSALHRRRYRPATLRGAPVEVNYQFRINLRLPR